MTSIDFKRPADHFNRGFESWECPQDSRYTVGETVVFTVSPDNDSNPGDYDAYDAERVWAWRNDGWRYVTLEVTILGGMLGDRTIGHASLSAVESDSTVEYLTSVLASLYMEAMTAPDDEYGRPQCGPNLDPHRPSWVAGMMVVNDEDLDTVARERAANGLSPVACNDCGRQYFPAPVPATLDGLEAS